MPALRLRWYSWQGLVVGGMVAGGMVVAGERTFSEGALGQRALQARTPLTRLEEKKGDAARFREFLFLLTESAAGICQDRA